MEYILMLLVLTYSMMLVIQAYALISFKMNDKEFLKEEIKFSLIIPFRNEENRITDLIRSINNLNYNFNFFEVIFIDDHSNDKTRDVIEKLINVPFKILSLHDNLSGKKAAIKYGSNYAQFNWLVFTDADCILEKNHFNFLNTFIISNNPDYIAGNLKLINGKGILYQLEHYENVILQGYTAAGFKLNNPIISNGANWAVKKQLFFNFNYSPKEGPSGDDVFFLHSLKSSSNCVYLPQLSVVTSYQKSLSSFISQKLRWASKSFKYFDKSAIWQGLVVGGGQIAFIGGLMLLLFSKKISILAILLLGIKLITDWYFYLQSQKLFKTKPKYVSMILCSVVYPFYSIAIATLSPFVKFNWKGRTY